MDAWLEFRERDSTLSRLELQMRSQAKGSASKLPCHRLASSLHDSVSERLNNVDYSLPCLWSDLGKEGLMKHIGFMLLLMADGKKMIAAFVCRPLSEAVLYYASLSEKGRAKMTFGRLSHWGFITPSRKEKGNGLISLGLTYRSVICTLLSNQGTVNYNPF